MDLLVLETERVREGEREKEKEKKRINNVFSKAFLLNTSTMLQCVSKLMSSVPLRVTCTRSKYLVNKNQDSNFH